MLERTRLYIDDKIYPRFENLSYLDINIKDQEEDEELKSSSREEEEDI